MADGYTAEGRRAAAFVLLGLGDDDGMQMRRRVWKEEQPGRWVLTRATREAARLDGYNLEEAGRAFGEPVREAGVDECPSLEEPWLEAFDDPDDGAIWIPYLEVARIIALDRQGRGDAHLARIWSDSVRSGQVQDPWE